MSEYLSGRTEAPLRDLVDASRFREALSLFLQWCEGSFQPSACARLLAAHAASRIGEYELAVTLATEAHAELRAATDENAILDCMNLLGAVAFERGDIDGAEVRFQSVLQMAEAGGCLRFIARAANNLAIIAHMRGQGERAMMIYGKALEAYHRIHDERGIIETLHNLAVSQRDAGRIEDTLRAWDRAVEAAERLGAGGLIALTLLGRAEQLIEGREFDQATADIERARLLAWMEGNEPHVLESERLRAFLSLRRGQPESAHRHAEVIRARALRSGCAWIAAESAAVAALALKADRRLPEAAAANDLAVASLVALGATGRLEIHARDWREASA